MPNVSHSTATRNRSHRDDGEEYASTRSPDDTPSVSARVASSTAMQDLQGTMGNSFVTSVSAGGVPAAPAAIPAAPEAEDDWWGGSSETEEASATPAAATEVEAEEGIGYGTRQPDEEDAGSHYSSDVGGGNEMSTEDTPGGAEAAYTDEAESTEDAGGDAGAGYTTGNNYGEVEAGPQDMEKEEDDSSWWPFGDDKAEEEPAEAGDDGGSWWDDIFGGSDEPDVDPGSDDGPSAEDKDPSEATQEEVEAEQDTITERETYSGAGSGPMVVSPVAKATSGATMSSGFTDGGRTGTVPVHSVFQCNFNEHPGGYPHAFIPGGKSGPVAWAGGGGAGPKGNEESGTMQDIVVPDYSSHGNLWNNADAYVEPGTGTLNVRRSYITSNAGDQGNGWYVTPSAAAKLEQHEQTHVAKAGANYNSFLSPMLAKVADSEALGKGKTFWRGDAKNLLKGMIGWKDALKGFEEQDKSDNGKGGQVDQDDMYSSGWPRNLGPGDLNGKHYENRLILNSERDPAVIGTPVDAAPKPTTP
jgi:hypothetical protein